jgi:hypothetical protein
MNMSGNREVSRLTILYAGKFLINAAPCPMCRAVSFVLKTTLVLRKLYIW